MNSTSNPTIIAGILDHPRSKDFHDLRDRAAYMYVTGTYPSHLRQAATRLLSGISEVTNRATGIDGRSGNMLIDPEVVRRLHLHDHPMVLKVREYLEERYRITVSLGGTNRKPYGKIFLSKGQDQVTVQVNGSVLDRW